VAIAVIDDLEAIDINERTAAAWCGCLFIRSTTLCQTSQKTRPGWKAGEHIVGSVKKQFFLSLFPFCLYRGHCRRCRRYSCAESSFDNHTLEMEPTFRLHVATGTQRSDSVRTLRSRTRAHGLQEIVRMNQVDHVPAPRDYLHAPLELYERKG